MSAVCQSPVVDSERLTAPPPTRKYFMWSFAGVYLGECFSTSPQDAREKFGAIRTLDPKRLVARVSHTSRTSQS